MPGQPPSPLIAGADPARGLDLLLVNAPLRDYSARPRVNDFTLPVLGMAYIATYAARQGYNVGVLDAEAHGLGIAQTVGIVNDAAPRWAGFNLLAPTYEVSAAIAAALDPAIKVMLGGHQAKAVPARILADPRMGRCEALILGEAETRAARLLGDHRHRDAMPGIMWPGPAGQPAASRGTGAQWLAPDINALPVVDRAYLARDPHPEKGRMQANMVGARGCPYNCSFCGAAVSANPDITIRVRNPDSILAEMNQLRREGVTAFRFVDDLFLGHRRVIDTMTGAFTAAGAGDWAKWDATGRINILNRLDDAALDRMAAAGLREVALGIESGSQRMLTLIDKRITPDMARDVVGRLTRHGISVKGYFILGFPGETAQEVDATVALIRELWKLTDPMPGGFTASAFEYRPYPGTPDWDRLTAAGKYTPDQLLNYTAVDLTSDGTDEALFERDEFNFSVNLPLADAPVRHIRASLVAVQREQWARLTYTAA